jgi:hypothetical protein
MTYGPATTNAKIAAALDALALRLSELTTPEEHELLCEASTRIEERGDDPEDLEDDDEA